MFHDIRSMVFPLEASTQHSPALHMIRSLETLMTLNGSPKFLMFCQSSLASDTTVLISKILLHENSTLRTLPPIPYPLYTRRRRDGRVVEGSSLENCQARKGLEGSNPSPSAIVQFPMNTNTQTRPLKQMELCAMKSRY